MAGQCFDGDFNRYSQKVSVADYVNVDKGQASTSKEPTKHCSVTATLEGIQEMDTVMITDINEFPDNVRLTKKKQVCL